MDVIDEVGPGDYKLVRRHISIDVSRVENSSAGGGRLETSDGLRMPDDVEPLTIQAWTLLWPSGSYPSSRRISFGTRTSPTARCEKAIRCTGTRSIKSGS